MDLYQGANVACTGRVTSFAGVTGVYGSDDVISEAPPERKPDNIWEWAEAARHLVAVIEPEPSDCVAEWARASDLPEPIIYERRDLRAQESERALLALEKTRVAREVQQALESYRREQPDGEAMPASWWKLTPQHLFTGAFVEPETRAAYAVVELCVGSGCGEFGGFALGIFKVTPSEWIDLTGDGDPRHSMPVRPYFKVAPHLAVATQRGSSPFMIGPGIIYGQARHGFVPVTTVGSIRTICGC